jgi:hypothetical protein
MTEVLPKKDWQRFTLDQFEPRFLNSFVPAEIA